MTDSIQVEGLDALSKKFDDLLMSNPDMEKKLTAIIRKFLNKVKNDVSSDVRNTIDNDPRQAYRAIRMAVYRRILGGNINILQKRRSSGMRSMYEPPRKLRPGQRGGNRVPRGARTQQVMDYMGSNRGFILRFLNSGTGQRMAGNRGGRLRGNRGSVRPRNFFNPSSVRAIAKDMDYLVAEVDKLIASQFVKGR